MYRFIDEECKGCVNLVCEGENFIDVFLEGWRLISSSKQFHAPFTRYKITDGCKGRVVWQTVPADAGDKSLIKGIERIR